MTMTKDGDGMMSGMAMLGRWSAGPFGWWHAASAAKPAQSPMEMWISLFPASPYFGVKWVWQDVAVDMQSAMSSMTGGLAGAMSAGSLAAPEKAAGPRHLSVDVERARLAPADLEKVLKEGVGLSGSAKAAALEEQGDEQNETVSIDLVRTAGAVSVRERTASPAEVAAAEARAAAEKAALDNVGGGALSDLSALGGVAAAFSADLSDSGGGRKTELRVVGGSETAPPQPKNLFSAPPAEADDLKLIRGVGPRLEKLLNEAGVYQFAQIAGFTDSDFAWLDTQLSTFKGRALRDKWREQAAELLNR